MSKILEKAKKYKKSFQVFWSMYTKSTTGLIGIGLIFVFVFIALFGPSLAPYNPYDLTQLSEKLQPPSMKHLLGTDDMGKDIFSLVIYGTRVSLFVGFSAAFISILLGTAVGLVAGYYSGSIGEVLMRVTDMFMCVPWLPFMILIALFVGTSIVNIAIIIGLMSWAGTARLVRSQVLTVKERPFIEATKAIGGGAFHIVSKHILPNVTPIIVANTILRISVGILTESTLSFLGLGDPTQASWGMILHYAFETGALSSLAYWYFLPPGLCILLLVLGFMFIGNETNKILNPRLIER